MSVERGTMQLPADRWMEVDAESNAALIAELARELSPRHILFGRQVRAIARSARQDDVLFEALDGDRAFFLVHLTWSRETDPRWPSTARFDTFEDFLRAEAAEDDD